MAHQALVFDHPTTPKRSPAGKTKIYTKVRWADEWVELTGARLDFAVWACAPSVPRAQITRRYGYGIEYGGNAFATVAPLNYLYDRRFIKIEIRYGDEDTIGWRWYGQIDVIADKSDGSLDENTPIGEQTILAYGLEQMFARHRIKQSEWWDGIASNIAEAGFVFNEDGKGNRTAAKQGGYYQFFHHNDPDGDKWSTQDIVEYLIESNLGVPLDDQGNDTLHFQLLLTDRERLPNWDAPELETHHVTAAQILNALVDRRRLMTWWLEVTEDESNVLFRVATFTDLAITIGSTGWDIPANPDTVTLDYSSNATAAQVVQTDTSHTADQIITYGAKRTTTCTVTFGVSTGDRFQAGWSAAQETDYESGGSGVAGYPGAAEISDRRRWHAIYRSREEVRPVYQSFKLRSSSVYPPGDPDSYKMFFGNVTLLPRIPLLEGVDYSGNTVASGSYVFPTGDLSERPPLVIIERPSDHTKYVKLADMGQVGKIETTDARDTADWSATIRVPKDGKRLTIDVVGAPQYTIAFDDFTPRAEDQQEHGEWDWKTMRATVTFQDERFAEGRYPQDAAALNIDAKRVLRIEAGEQYRLDYLVNGTVVDVDGDGGLLTATNDGYLRDDRAKLTDLAFTAHQWYAKKRKALRIRADWDEPAQNLRVGQYVTAVGRAAPLDTEIDALITQVAVEAVHVVGPDMAVELPTLKYEITTAFGELDFVRLRGA